MATSQLQPRMKVADYELLRLLGRGGMGDVWLGQDLLADRLVAIKFIKPHLVEEPGFLKRFLNEAKTLGRLEHDRIVRLHRVLQSDGHVALILGFIDGTSLADLIDTQAPLPMEVVLRCVRDVLPALSFAHERGIIHRDIKPPNILIDHQGRSFLSDFGIAVVEFAEHGTRTGFAMGTPHYMSPEQIQTPRELSTQTGGHRSDIYSFGVVLFEMITGQLPFGAHGAPEQTFQVQSMHCTAQAPRPTSFNPAVSPAVEDVIMQCLEKNPDHRPQTCTELLSKLENASIAGASRSAARSATVFEGAPAQGGAGGTVVVPQIPVRQKPQAVTTRSSGMPRFAWLGLGSVVIAGAIGYAVLTQSKPSKESPKETVVTTPNPSGQATATPPSSTPSGQTLARPLPGGPKPTNTSNIQQPPPQVPGSAPVSAAPLAAEAQQLVSTARPCEAEPRAERAAQLNPQYRPLYEKAVADCTNQKVASTDAAEAESLFRDGEYCPAQAKMKLAKSRYSDPKYASRLAVMEKACADSLR